MFYCLGEPGYETSSWYMHIVSGLLNEKRSKRFTVFLAYDIDEIEKFPITKDDVLFIIGSAIKWLDVVIDTCEKKFDNRIVVLGNCERKKGKKYSIVASDVSHDIRLLYKYLKTHKKNNIAMYGINPHSAYKTFKREVCAAPLYSKLRRDTPCQYVFTEYYKLKD